MRPECADAREAWNASGAGSGIQNYAAAQAFVTGIKDRVLSRGCSSLRDRKSQLQDALLPGAAQFTVDLGLAMPQPGPESSSTGFLQCLRRTVYPVQLSHPQVGCQQGRMIMPLNHDQRVAILIFGHNKPRSLRFAGLPADIESVALPQGVIGKT